MSIVNQHGRPWSELDALKARFTLGDNDYKVVSADGIPLCGSVGRGGPSQVFVAIHWKMENIQ